jgi:hypothetical protein
MARGKVCLSPDEAIATLRNSSLPTVVAEGSDDIIILRRIEQLYSDKIVSVLDVGGRESVLQLYERRSELPSELPIVFVVDRDLWVVGGVPAAYQSDMIVLTDGYSIENDAIRDGNFLNLMTNGEKAAFEVELRSICKWFAASVVDVLRGGDSQLRTHPDSILANQEALQAAEYIIANDIEAGELHKMLSADAIRLLRGKTLLNLLMRQLSYTGRPARHRTEALLDQAGAAPGALLTSLFNTVGVCLGFVADA